MRILVFSWRDPKHPTSGGAEQVMHEHMKGWAKAGNTVTLFSSRMPGLVKRETMDGIEIVREGYQYLGVQLSGFMYYFRNRDKYNFIVDQFHGIPFFTPLYSQKPKLAVIQEPARDVWFKNPLSFPFNWIIGLLGYLVEPIVFLFYKNTKFMTGSLSAKENLKKYGIKDQNITVVPHGVITPSEKLKRKKEKVKTIIYLGILSKDKGIEDAIRTFKILSKEGDYRFWVIGRGETKAYEQKVKKMAGSLKGKIRFWGHVSDSKKFELLAKAHLLINPSVHEGWGLVNIEANSVGTPVISYPSAGLIDSVKDKVSGIIVKDKTPSSLAHGVEDLLFNKEYYRELVIGAINWSKSFSWKKSQAMSVDLIKKIYAQN